MLTTEGKKDIIVKIAVEMCGAEGVFSKMAFGSAANMIVKNEWKQKNVARLDKDIIKEMKEIYHLFVVCDNLTFKMILCKYKQDVFWYVKPHTSEIKNADKERIVMNTASMCRLHTNNFVALTENESLAFSLIKLRKIFYCSNECGTDFQQALQNFSVR